MRESIQKHKNKYRDGKAFQRFLESRVGQHWDDVYSEICKLFDTRSSIGDEFRRMIKWNVELECYIEDGVVYEGRNWHRRTHREPTGLYVHPITGILGDGSRNKKKISPWLIPRSDERDIDTISVADMWYQKENGAWFAHWTTKDTDTYPLTLREDPPGNFFYDVKEFTQTTQHKRQLNSNEVKTLLRDYGYLGNNRKYSERTNGRRLYKTIPYVATTK